MPQPAKRTEVEASIIPVPVNVAEHLVFNRFRVSLLDGSFVLIEFALVDDTGEQLNPYRCAIHKQHLIEQAPGIRQYVKSAEDSKTALITDLVGRLRDLPIHSAAFLQLTRSGDVAEVGVVNYSMAHFVNATRAELDPGSLMAPLLKAIQDDASALSHRRIFADTVALLRCSVACQNRLIFALLRAIE